MRGARGGRTDGPFLAPRTLKHERKFFCPAFSRWAVMNFALKNLSRIVATASPRALVATLVAIHMIGIVILAFPEVHSALMSYATSLGHLAWSQLSTPGPPTPAGDITMKVIRIWWNHVLEVEIPRFVRIDQGILVELRSFTDR